MLPVITIGSFELSSYLLMMFIGIYGGLVYTYLTVVRKKKIFNFPKWKLAIIFVIGLLLAFGGAFLFDSLFHSIEHGHFVMGGITYLGGVVLAIPLTIVLIHFLLKLSWNESIKLFSLLIPSIVFAHAMGRIGCFLGGCCYGVRTDSWLGVQFPGMNYKVLPTQLFEAIFEFVLFIVMVILRKRIEGKELEIYLISYSVFRFIIEFFRGDNRGQTGIGISPAQLLSIVCLVSAVAIILLRYYKNRKEKALS